MLQYLKNKLRTSLSSNKYKPPQPQGEFSARIIHRHRTFWKSADAEYVRNLPMDANMPLAQWKAEPHWQRTLSNKNNSREFAKMHGCLVPELYWKGRDLEQLDFKIMPEQYVIRPTIGHSCNLVFLMNKGFNLMDKTYYSETQLRAELDKALRKNPYMEFLIEEFVRSESGEYKIPDDYKISMFNGEVALIDVINRVSPKEGLSSCYDENWNMIENISQFYKQAPYQKPPACLEEMITFAKTLSKSYEIYVRIDFYATDKGAVFGEFTPTPAAGAGFTPKAEQVLAGYWDKYCNGSI
ncbi:ATP-grasp fold amidoligase family protein [Pontibacter sp. 13R65]|uniref:ATP-grasp fold amidoligase family protein n=1 Tax=Pontibacter sp. 13R65 TaxID=3127458 RepID=UPI00301D5298